MYKNKPLIIGCRPWYRSPVFPWGWYSITQDAIHGGYGDLLANGYYKPDDGGQCRFAVVEKGNYTDDGGTIFTPLSSPDTAFIRQWHPNDIKWFGAKND